MIGPTYNPRHRRVSGSRIIRHRVFLYHSLLFVSSALLEARRWLNLFHCRFRNCNRWFRSICSRQLFFFRIL